MESLSGEQLGRVCTRLAERCSAGNTWPPDLSDFIAQAAECAGGALGLTTADVLAEYKRWRTNSWCYSSSDDFPWRHPVMYHICIEIRRVGIERKLTQSEHEKLATTLLQRWEKKIASGYSIPPVKKQIASPEHPSGPTPAQRMHEEFLRRKAAGKCN